MTYKGKKTKAIFLRIGELLKNNINLKDIHITIGKEFDMDVNIRTINFWIKNMAYIKQMEKEDLIMARWNNFEKTKELTNESLAESLFEQFGEPNLLGEPNLI